MILLFHYFGIFLFQFLNNRKRLKQAEDEKSSNEICECRSEYEYEIIFDPPVYKRRYAKVSEILLDERWRSEMKKLVDFGCAEFGLFVFLKQLTVQDIFFVDIEEDLLLENIGRLMPLIADRLRRRSEKMDITVFVGSVSDPDYRLQKTDCVTAIELIEHLYPDVLDAFAYNIFGYIVPKLVIVTTPNVEFNVIFQKMGKFRHPDHKFEWTRQQFEDWANNISTRFPDYTVEFFGIGEHRSAPKDIGCCSQMAVFIHKSLLEEGYVSSVYSVRCRCKNDSPCKGVTVQSKLLCKCLCALCQPNTSVGICTYYSYSKQIISYETMDNREFNPSYNIYFKLIQKIQYPFEVDTRSEEERMLDTFRYRINLYGNYRSRFYVEERDRCEIPLSNFLYGCELQLSLTELCNKLKKFGYAVENCVIQETQQCEDCVVYRPDMEEYSSTPETASDYDSEGTKYQANEESSSDWDEAGNKIYSSNTTTHKDIPAIKSSAGEGIDSHADADDDKRQQDSLFDSGYQKSISLVDDSPQTPQDLEETDIFDETSSSITQPTESNKTSSKRASNREKDTNKLKLDPNKVNELDRCSALLVVGPLPKPNSDVLRKNIYKDSMPGPSNIPKRKKKAKKQPENDDSPLADAKFVANTIIFNSLNKIDVGNEERNAVLIEAPVEENREPQVQVVVEERVEVMPIVIEDEDEPVPLVIVENGDLANNNRDREGNNYIADQEEDGNDFINDNLDVIPLPDIIQNNAVFDNNNLDVDAPNVAPPDLAIVEEQQIVLGEENVQDQAEPVIAQSQILNAENVTASNRETLSCQFPDVVNQQQSAPDLTENESESFAAIAIASREALYDPNSTQDSLDDFEVPLSEASVPVNVEDARVNGPELDGDDPGNHQNELAEGDNGVRSHFYCQGDGLGVHPSVIAVELVEDEDTTTNSTVNTDDFAEVDQDVSYQEISSLPDEAQNSEENRNGQNDSSDSQSATNSNLPE